MTNTLIDYHFYNYLYLNYGFRLLKQFLVLITLIILMSFSLYFISKKIERLSITKNMFVIPVVIISFILLSLPNGIIYGIYTIYNPTQTNLEIPQHTPIKVNSYAKDSKRFIAHAGGQIDGHKYTNTLEALDLNYKNGFRLFELDIHKTKDNIYVAVHDWKSFVETTGYKGDLPPSRQDFLQQKIHGKYSPIDITDINVWFYNHPDAILVTDKVNTPIDFSNKFIDKNRLMMELFSWDAVKKGLDAKIRSAMPNGYILKDIKGDKGAYLKKLGVKDVVTSRHMVKTHKELLVDMVHFGIHVFAYHINANEGKGEVYTVCNERDYFYGMYADKFDFNATINCSKKESK